MFLTRQHFVIDSIYGHIFAASDCPSIINYYQRLFFFLSNLAYDVRFFMRHVNKVVRSLE